MRPPQPVHVHDPATHLEGADGRVVFVLHPHFASGALVKQRPRVLRRRWHEPVDELGSGFKLGERVALELWQQACGSDVRWGRLVTFSKICLNPLTTGTERAHRIITATMYLFAPSR